MLTNEVIMWYHTTSVQDEAPFCYGEMSERLKEPVLKTGEAQVSVGSNPTLSAKQVSVGSNPTLSANFIWTCRSTQEAEGAPLLRE